MSLIAQRNPKLEIPRRRIGGQREFLKFGSNPNVTSGVQADLWTPGTIHVPPTAARIHDLVSADAADAAAGTGLQTIRVIGTDAAFLFQEEELAMNGVTPVPTTKTYTRVFRLEGLTAGSGQVNAGTISCTAQVDTSLSASMLIGTSHTLMAIATVPADRDGFLTRAYGSMFRNMATGNSQMQMSIMERTGIETANPVLRIRHTVSFSMTGTSARDWPYDPYKPFVGPCDIFWRIDLVTDNNTAVQGGFDMVWVDK